LPYIGENFSKQYIISNYIGESFSSLIPGVLALAQGLGQNPGCHNITDLKTNTISLVPKPLIPNFSVSIYFILIFSLLCACTLAFSWLHFSKTAIRERETKEYSCQLVQSSDQTENHSTDSTQGDFSNFFFNKNGGYHDFCEKVLLNILTVMITFICFGILPGLKSKTNSLSFYSTYKQLCLFQPILLGIQSYSTLPYGNNVFNYAINLSK
jgi:hypothetical protein